MVIFFVVNKIIFPGGEEKKEEVNVSFVFLQMRCYRYPAVDVSAVLPLDGP